MHRATSFRFILMFVIAGLLWNGTPAYGQQPPLGQQLIGTWGFVVTAAHRKDGTKVDIFGPNPNGVLMFHPDGHFAMLNTRPGRPHYAGNNRAEGTADEFKQTVLGSIAYFGTYTVDEAKKEFVLTINGSTFPNYEGTVQVRPFTIDGNELRSINPYPSQGGAPIDLVLRRLK